MYLSSMIASGVTRRAPFVITCLLPLILAGGCLGGGASDDTYSLSAVSEVKGPKSSGRQILIPEPTALKALDSEQIVIRVGAAEIQYLSKSRWSDRLPRMVQSRLAEGAQAFWVCPLV